MQTKITAKINQHLADEILATIEFYDSIFEQDKIDDKWIPLSDIRNDNEISKKVADKYLRYLQDNGYITIKKTISGKKRIYLTDKGRIQSLNNDALQDNPDTSSFHEGEV